MPKKMGEALREVVGEGVSERREEKKRPESVLMNPNRQKIFQFLCNFPCSHQKRIANRLGLSDPTVRWHLQKLVRSGYVDRRMVKGKAVYYPAEMIANDGTIETFFWMGNRDNSLLFLTILTHQGSTIDELSERLERGRSTIRSNLSNLEKLGLIVPLVDGRFKRYFPTDAVMAIDSKNKKRLRQFKKFLMRKLESDRLNPEVHISRSREAEIQIKIGKTRTYLMIPPEPLATVIASAGEVS